MPRPPSFLDELKRRKVVRVAIVYAAVSWAVVQIADVAFPAFGAPGWVMRVLMLLLAMGAPAALVLAWAFEVTSAGVKRTPSPGDRRGEEVGASPSARVDDERESGGVGSDADGAGDPSLPDAAPATGHAWISPATAFAAGLLIGLGWLMGSVYGPGSEGGRPAERGGAAAGTGAASVAVLPFRDVGASEDETNFAIGLHDDLLTRLGTIEALRVTSRTSVMRYADRSVPLRQVGEELGVATVLDGGVQRSGGQVRLNVQLVEAATDRPIWGETYTRPLTAENVFALQSEIAREVASALEATLTEEEAEVLDAVPTDDLVALEQYYRAERIVDSERSARATRQAIDILEGVVERDPDFARARALLTRSLAWEIRVGASSDTLPARRAMEETLQRAPGTTDAAVAEGYYLYYARGDYAGASGDGRRSSSGSARRP